MGKSSTPSAPDPVATANAQTQSNIATANNNAVLNRINQYTPYGSSVYDVTGYNGTTPEYSQTLTLSPEQQQLYDKYTQGQNALADTALGQLNNVQANFAQPFSLRNDPTKTDFTTATNNARDAAYKTATNYLNPYYAEQQSNLNAQLANAGLSPGGEAYDRAQGDFQRNRDLAYSQAESQAFGQGLQAQNQGFNQGLQGAGLQFAEYNQPLSTYNALITGAQPTNPTFQSIPGVSQAGVDVAGITNQGYQNQLAASQQRNAATNNLYSLGGSLAALALLA